MPAASNLRVRSVSLSDVPAIRAIYAAEVERSSASFELVPPDEREVARRLEGVLAEGNPYLVAEIEGSVAGFAYASQYRARPAYRFTVEDSVYVDESVRNQGVGASLLQALIDRCTAAGKRQMVAVISNVEHSGSVRLHARLGFTHAGRLRAVGYKFGRWEDTVFMQREIGEGESTAPEVDATPGTDQQANPVDESHP